MEKYRTLSIGRSLAVAGHANHPLTYYFGQQEVAFGKQWWNEWFPISDSIFKSSAVGAITVAIWCECGIRRNGQGYAIQYLLVTECINLNGGKTWSNLADKADAMLILKYIPLMLTSFCAAWELLNLIRNAVFTAQRRWQYMAISSF
jgi:hypothetical protein